MMTHVGFIVCGALGGGFVSAYLWFNAARILERTLDTIILFQARVRGGYYRKIDPNERCPSCGAKDGEISFNPMIQRVVHTCNVDGAQWAEKTRIPVEKWDFVGRDVKHVGDKKSDLDAIMDRANAETLHRKGEEKAN
jgi:hypothetical protein